MQQPANRELAAPHVICVGRLSGEKHVDAIIKGHSRVVREYPGATLTIVGDGGHRAALAQLVKRLDLTRSVRFLGRRDDVAELLRHANVYVSASSVEGLVGYATLEAALAGLPIVATNIPSVAELLEGLPSVRLVAPNRPEDIARAVDDIFSKRDIMADEIEATRRFLVSALDADSSIRELEQLYAAVA
jgi:glycosyltransferase involved in cell wall biosynthesis